MLDNHADSFLESAPLSTARVLSAGVKLGNFEIVGLLGRGGMGEVWRARDPRLKREVAIKVLPALFASDRDRGARFEREARAASALNHPNIVTVYDVGQEDRASFIVSELVEGETLAEAIKRRLLPLRRLIDVATQIADGLAAAHALE
jgi:serine/threonine protein kinase